jgi:hypothetical protein
VSIVFADHQGTDPGNVVAAAKKSYDATEHDEVWCVFDTEGPQQPHRRQQALGAMERARELGYSCAVSNPSFEYWLLLHHERCVATLPNSAAAERRLRHHVEGYTKGALRFEDFKDFVDRAVADARKLFEERCPAHRNNPCDCHPCTQVYLLVDSLTRVKKGRPPPD